MHTKPHSTNWYVFGSYLHSNSPSDIDLLVVYDPSKVHPKDVTKLCAHLFSIIENSVSLKVHSTILTCTEEQESKFIERSNAVDITELNLFS